MNRVTSEVWSPVLSAVYVLMLPVWVLLTIQQFGAAGGRFTPAVFAAALVAVVSVGLVLRGLALARQNVAADDRGLRLGGFGGFDVPWDAVAELRTVRRTGATNTQLLLKPGHTATGDLPPLRGRRRTFGVQPDRVDALLRLAAEHGVVTSA